MRIKRRTYGARRITTRPQIGEYCHEDIVRDPKMFKGLRQRFRTFIKAPTGFKYRTELLRHGGPGAHIAVLVRKGNADTLRAHIENKCPHMKFEDWSIRIYQR